MSLPNGRRIAIDVGTVRNGLAISDQLGITANPVGSFSEVDLLAKIMDMHQEDPIVTVYVGLPLHLSGVEGESAKLARALARKVAELKVAPVHLVDERLTSKTAQGHQAGIEEFGLDALAAVEILKFALAGELNRGVRFGKPLELGS